MMAELCNKVKSGEEWTSTLHLSQPQCLSGFQGNLWRVKSEIESGVFLTQTDSTCNQKASANRNNSPIEIYLPTHYFLPGNGTILPQLRATLCHNQAKSGISLLSNLNKAHSVMTHTFQKEWKNCFLLKFRKWFKNGLKAQKLLAQGIALGNYGHKLVAL